MWSKPNYNPILQICQLIPNVPELCSRKHFPDGNWRRCRCGYIANEHWTRFFSYSNQLLVKDSQRSKKPVDSTLYLNQSKQLYCPPHLNHSNPKQSKTSPRLSKPHFPNRTPQGTTPSGSTPTRFNQELNLEEKLKVFLDKYMKEYLNYSHSANQAKQNSGEDISTEDTQEDDEGFFVQMDQTNQLQVMSLSEPNTELIHDSGPANSPQTNGISEWFNQALLTKFRCLLAQSNVLINFWDEAVKYSSLLINILPSRSLNWKSPVSTLLDHSSTIEPTRNLNKLIPFGLKAFVSRSMGSKVLLPSKPLLYLDPEDYSDAGHFLDPQNHRFVVSRDYTPTNIKFDYHSPDNVNKPISMLPNRPLTTTSSANPNTFTTIPLRASSPKPTSQHQSCSHILSPPTQELPIVLTKKTEPEEPPTLQKASIAPTSLNTVSQDNILASPRRKKIPTKGNPCSSTVDEDLLLNKEVPFKTALRDPNEAPRWKEVIDKEFNSLTSKNTGTLVPSLGTDKTIRGLWRLVRKRNEFGEVLKYKARWHALNCLRYYCQCWSIVDTKPTSLMWRRPSYMVRWMHQTMSPRLQTIKYWEKKTGFGNSINHCMAPSKHPNNGRPI
ncbi:hypothetical protein O181_059162 [Austropuccinia psidii MF-1]|uniref:Integrase catalytic domain-containing protein n=1 Tax=Austropuccinia psidii MF-1 TaxID=1389203 RepID=A0A9Q3HX60_9BASI|nr:hypothetical protein [Austropuccinia psidii MF-1]